MKKSVIISVITLSIAVASCPFALAASSSHSEHTMSADTGGNVMDAMDGEKTKDVMTGMSDKAMETSAEMMIHSSMVKHYALDYKLIDMREKLKGMKGMPEMKATHHLMLFVKTHEGVAVTDAMVGYLLKNPDGTLQKAMTMGMSGGYGADVNLGQPGTYTIKAKALVGKDKLVDEFQYEVKAH